MRSLLNKITDKRKKPPETSQFLSLKQAAGSNEDEGLKLVYQGQPAHIEQIPHEQRL